jgi:hypothetical protein
LLRKAMAEALRRALAEHRSGLFEDLHWTSRLDAWDRNLAQAQASPEKLDLFLPPVLSDDLWSASNPHSPSGDEQTRALAILLRDWLTSDLRTLDRFSEDDARSLAHRILPAWRRKFAGIVAQDTSSFLFQAFTLEGINRLRAEVEQNAK